MNRVPDDSRQDDWPLVAATDADVEELMGWFTSRQATVDWGGPHFRYPFTRESFLEDCRLDDMAAYCLRDADGALCGFGQFYNRNDRINLARLVAHPDMRGKGIGTRLISMLMEEGARCLPLAEYSLFVYKHNEPAYRCYKALGFVETEFPKGGPLIEGCHYMTRPVTTS
jgi:ribosomal protein S18 acetylase RimI-like enzyme